MSIQTIQKAFWFVFLLAFLNPHFAAKASPQPARMTISVYNDANIPEETIVAAEATASNIFRRAGLDIHWMRCTPSIDDAAVSAACSEVAFPRHLHVRILARSRNLTNATLGVSYLSERGIGCYADVFFAPIADLLSPSGQGPGAILGQVIAHEVAHLLLGANSHSERGIMRSQWKASGLLRIVRGKMFFTEEQSQVMRQRLAVKRQTVGD